MLSILGFAKLILTKMDIQCELVLSCVSVSGNLLKNEAAGYITDKMLGFHL